MRKKVLIFGQAADVTPDDYDGKKYRFPFAVLNRHSLGHLLMNR
jgi:hypothetical protein